MQFELKSVKPAKRYSEALFMAAGEKFPQIADEFEEFINYVKQNEELHAFLFHPVVLADDKKEIIRKVFPDMDSKLKNLLFIMIDAKRLDSLDEILTFLKIKKDEIEGLLTVDVILAVEPDEDTKNIIKTRLEAKFNSKLIINYKIDTRIIGGMCVKSGDTLIDLSIKNKLENFKKL